MRERWNDNMKVVIVGGVAGGATAAARIRRLNEQAEIVVFERSGYISYANCGLPYYIGDVITDRSDLILQTPESFFSRFHVNMKVRHEVTAIHPEKKEVTVKMTNFNTILNDLFAAEDKKEYIRSLNGYELLIIDDLGVERSSEYVLENIFSVIDWRYRSGKPLIITTNLPLAQLKQETKIEKKRIYDRILERCIPVKIDGVSRREAMANDNMQTMKNILKI